LFSSTGSLIKLPKPFSTQEKQVPSSSEPNPVVRVESKCEYEEVDWRADRKEVADSVEIKVKNISSEVIPAQEPEMIEIDISRRVETEKSNPEEMECSSNADDESTEYGVLRRVIVDHPYSSSSDSSSSITTLPPNKCAVTPTEYQTINVNNLYYLNGESSSELNSFMIHETLNQPVSCTVVLPKNFKQFSD
jgi:hypothetical protein